MSIFKDLIQNDIDSVFFNKDEFATTHNIDGEDIVVLIDNELLKERQAKFAEGMYLGDILFSVKKKDLGYEPAIDQSIKFDGERMRIKDFHEDDGVYIITVGANMS